MTITYERTKSIPNNILGNLLTQNLETSPITTHLHSLNSQRSRETARFCLYHLQRYCDGLLHPSTTEEALVAAGIHKYDIIYFINWHTLRYVDLVLLQERICTVQQPRIVNLWISVLKGVLKQARNLGLVSSENYARVISLRRLPAKHELSGRYVSDEELGTVIGYLLSTSRKIDLRTAATLSLAYTCGIRIGELENLQYTAYDPQSGELRVRGKGDKERIVFVLNRTKVLLERWISIRGNKTGPMFITSKGKKISENMMRHSLVRALHNAKVAHFTFHDLRRKCASDLIDLGVDAITIAKLLGHVEIQTTMRYDRGQQKRARQSIARREIPKISSAIPKDGNDAYNQQSVSED